MNALLETLLTALALSASAACCLALLPHAPPRLRFAVAAAGLAAWLIPWGALPGVLPATVPPSSFAAPLAATLHAAAAWGTLRVGTQLDVATILACALAAALPIGLALFARDCRALRRSVRRWRAASRPADHLRSLLPLDLAGLPAEIRIVANSDVAATSGFGRSTVWIGDRYDGEQLRLILVHEMCHVRARDPLWLLALAAVRRVYWWNPVVAHLARQALLMLESTCDHRSAAHFEKRRYVGELASLVLAGAAPAPRMIATMPRW
jgi:bla regulator protein blaR1